MKFERGWWWPSHEQHMLEWMAEPRNRLVMNDRETYQGRKQLAFLKHCGRFRNVVDVGGHVGLWSYNLARAFKHVYAFEPVQAHRECFLVNVQNEFNVTLFPYALGADTKLVRIDTTHGSSGDSRVSDGIDVEMRTLDGMGLTDVDALKIDCEGYEENVLRGATKLITECGPTIIVEQKRDMATRFGLKPQGAVEMLQNKFGYRLLEEIAGDYIMEPT